MNLLGTYTVGIIDTIWPLIFVIVVSLLFYLFRHQILQTPLRKWIPLLMLGLMVVYEVNYFINLALIFSRDISITIMNLPLHLCGSSAVLVMLFLATRKEIFLDILILQGIIGAIVTFIFPDLSAAPLSYEYLRFFLAHALLFLVPMYYIIVEGKRIDKSNLIKGLVFIHALAVVSITVNLIFHTHYIYITPDNTTNLYAFLPIHEAIPFLGKWPAVILFGEMLALPVYFAVYFIVKKIQSLITYKEGVKRWDI